jgi:ADP-ribose pyrophosphatase YjhB (NUDIX family)
MNEINELLKDIKKEKKEYTLLFIIKDEKILLGLKKIGFGKGFYNGFGGETKKNESMEETTKKEIFLQSGIEVEKMEKRAVIFFDLEGLGFIIVTHIFVSNECSGEIVDSDDMEINWFDLSSIPNKIWAGFNKF